jgi:hypothetical protein
MSHAVVNNGVNKTIEENPPLPAFEPSSRTNEKPKEITSYPVSD